jgi:nucleotide-binding universal stress UspA family protein
MSNYNRVLIPIDLTPGIGPLTPAVRRLIDTSESEITLLHVVESQPWLGRNSHTVRLMTELELLAHRQFRGARITRRIEWGRPADRILSVIRAAGMDAVLLSAGHAAMGTSALGPVVSEVLAEAPCPVLMEWAMTAPVNRARTQPVCCAIGSEESDEAVLKEAVWAAERMEAPLKIVCALEPDLSRPALLWEPSIREREIAQLRSRIEGMRDRWAPGCAVQVNVGLPVSVYSRAIRLHGAGLLVTGGSRTVAAAESECPVLYVGPGKRSQAERPAVYAAGRSA